MTDITFYDAPEGWPGTRVPREGDRLWLDGRVIGTFGKPVLSDNPNQITQTIHVDGVEYEVIP